MRRRLIDILLILAILALPFLGALQACDGGSSGSPSTPPPTNRAPVAVLSHTGPDEGPTPLIVKLDASGSYDPDGDKITFLWLFSDGTTADGAQVEHEFTTGGRHSVRLTVTDKWGVADDEGPIDLLSYGLANSAWPKYAHDERNSGVSQNTGPMMDLANAEAGGAFPRYWRGGSEGDIIRAICVGYDGVVIYTQGTWLRARTASGDVLWDLQAESVITAWPAIAYDGSIIVGTKAGWVHKVSPDGIPLWSVDLRNSISPYVRLLTAINIDHNANIYLCGMHPYEGNAGYSPYECALVKLSFDGELLWQRQLPKLSSSVYMLGAAPAILPNGNIVVNGIQGAIFTPEGDLVAEIIYPPAESGTKSRAPLGPPSVGPDGSIVFSHLRAPLFTDNGAYVLNLLGPEINLWESVSYGAGYVQAPVWSPDGVTLLERKNGNDNQGARGFYLLTRSSYGGLARTRLITFPTSDNPMPYYNNCVAGAAEDRLGRIYTSCLGLRAYSPVSAASIYPFVSNRYSMWSYTRPSSSMTPPVIGDDNWLYVGYGNDILAIGD